MAETMDPAQVFEQKLLSRHKTMNEATECGDSVVQQFYYGKTVFLTGGSGFLGKQLIEKLFRATNISKVFILLRSKKGIAIQQRLNEILQDPVYDMLRKQQPDFIDKIVPVSGDVAELRLGMSDKDWKMVTEQVDIIFHMAATTRFDESLHVATKINVRGTREALVLGKDCKKLKSFVHISTAYSYACKNLINTDVLEDFYQSPVDPEIMIKLAETVDEERLNNMSSSFINNWPNMYSFTKAVAEDIVRTSSDHLPISIVRPAIVICARREPSPGWVDMSNVYGASGIILGIVLGLMHIAFTDDNIYLGLIPVDYVNNAIIAAGWDAAKRKAAGKNKMNIYTLISSTRNPVNWGKLQHTFEKNVIQDYSSPAALWYNFVWQTSNPVLFWMYTWLLHLIPAYIIDSICFVLRKERRFVKIYSKMFKMSTALSYFGVNNWHFDDKNTAKLYDSLSTADKEIFNFDVKEIDWQEYMISWCIGIRKYILKDGLKASNYAFKKQIVFRILTYILVPLYFWVLFKVLCFAVGIFCSFSGLFCKINTYLYHVVLILRTTMVAHAAVNRILLNYCSCFRRL